LIGKKTIRFEIALDSGHRFQIRCIGLRELPERFGELHEWLGFCGNRSDFVWAFFFQVSGFRFKFLIRNS